MGICDSVNKTNRNKLSINCNHKYDNINTINGTLPSDTTTYPTTTVTTQNNTLSYNDNIIQSSKGKYILNFPNINHSDINLKYKLSPAYIGHGSSGTVYEATDSSGKKYAIKSINKHSITHINEIINEAQISLSLSHKNIIKYYEIYEDEKCISFVMDLAEGGDLLDFVTKAPNKHLNDDIAIDIIVQILEVITYLHRDKRICHRDIKPENFLIVIKEDACVEVKLIDFGFASVIDDRKLMKDNLGTPMYMAPEIVIGEAYNEKIDIWSVGILLFNLLTGCQPFRRHSVTTLEDQILGKRIEFECIENKDLRMLCSGMLERSAEHRYNAERALKCANEIKSKMKSCE